MAAQTFRHLRLTIRFRPRATASEHATTVGTDMNSSCTVLYTAAQKVESVNTFSYSRRPTNWLAPPGTVR